MRAARLHAARDVRVEEVPTPTPAVGQVLVRVRAVAICPSDWRLYADGNAGGAPLQEPIIQGHEFAGDVVALGPDVAGPPVGTRVGVEPSWHCDKCDMCAQGRFNICRNIVFPSFPPHDGALAEYIACPVINVQALPDHVSYAEGALVEPLGVAMHAVRLADPKPDDRVVILGAGAIGLFALSLLKLAGIKRVTVVEPVEGRRELAGRLGASGTAPFYKKLLEDGHGDIVIECSGESGATEQALEVADHGGKVVAVGIPRPETVCFEAFVPRRKELTLIFSRRSRDTLADALEMVSSGDIPVREMPMRQFSLDRIPEAMEATAARPGDMLRAIVEP